MLDNTGGGGKTNNVRQYRGGEKTMLDNTGGGRKTNDGRQYRGRGKEGEGKDKQC